MSTPAGAASATALPGRCERARESSRPERRRRRSSDRERSCSGGKHGLGRSPSPARSDRSASLSASSSSESLDTEERVSAMPPPPTRRPGVGGGHSRSDRSAPGPSGLGSGEQSTRAQSIVAVLPPLLQVRRKMTEVVPMVQSLWIRMFLFGLFFASSRSFIAWMGQQV